MKTLEEWDKHLHKLEVNFKMKYGSDDETYEKDIYSLLTAYYATVVSAIKEGLILESEMLELAHNIAQLEEEPTK